MGGRQRSLICLTTTLCLAACCVWCVLWWTSTQLIPLPPTLAVDGADHLPNSQTPSVAGSPLHHRLTLTFSTTTTNSTNSNNMVSPQHPPQPLMKETSKSGKDNAPDANVISPPIPDSPFIVLTTSGQGAKREQTEIKSEQDLKEKKETKKKEKKKLILFYNMPDWFLSGDASQALECCARDDGGEGEGSTCMLTTDRSLLPVAHAVIFHTFFFWDPLPPSPRPPGQVWVAFGMEAPYALSKNMMSPEWTSAFNLTMTYRRDSDFFTPYGILLYRGEQKERDYSQVAHHKTRSAAWFVSNCHTPSRRELYVRQLRKYYPVDIFGACGPLHCPRWDDSSTCLQMLNSTYRFYLAFESALCRDYVTEKLFKLFRDGLHVIPVVRGGLRYQADFPAGTFIDAADFPSPLHLARHLKELEGRPESYGEMVRQKDKYVALTGSRQQALCRLCDTLQSRDGRHIVSGRSYRSLSSWMTNGMCWAPKDVHF